MPVPKPLRPNRGCSVLRKAGNTYKEALANRSKVEAQVLKELGSELKKNSLVERIEVSYNKPDGPFAGQNLALSELPQSDKELLRDVYPVDVDDNGNPINSEEASLWLALEGKTTWQMWFNRRVAVEEIAKSTVSNWRSKFKGLSEWAKTDYLGDLTKQQAIQYKEHLISIGHETGTVINTIGAFSGF